MRRPPPWQRLLLWGLVLGLLASGLCLLPRAWFADGAEPGFWEDWRPFSAPLHGALGLGMAVLLGAFAGHVCSGLRAGRNRLWGYALLGCLGLLLASAWGIYYLSPDAGDAAGRLHALAGFGLPAVLLLHRRAGRRGRG